MISVSVRINKRFVEWLEKNHSGQDSIEYSVLSTATGCGTWTFSNLDEAKNYCDQIGYIPVPYTLKNARATFLTNLRLAALREYKKSIENRE